MPFVRLRNRKRRHARSSALPRACPGAGRQRRLRMNAAKQKNKSPAENLVSSAAPKGRPNRSIVPRDGDRHMSAKAHKVTTKNKVMAMSVRTKGPNARMTGMVEKAQRQ